MNISRIKRLSRKYGEIEKIGVYIGEALLGNSYYLSILKNSGIDTSLRNLRRLKKYIDIYKAVFLKNYSGLNEDDGYIVKEVYIKGKSVCKASVENYMSPASIYRILKKFDLHFYYDIIKCSRIINPLLKAIEN